jgi:DCN1-like protein 1/2
MSTPAQKKALKEFKAVTNTSDKVATEALKKTNWDLERALDGFFNKGGEAKASGFSFGSDSKVDKTKLGKIFDKYAGTTEKDKDLMFDEKLAEYLKAIGVDPEGAASLGVAWRLKCKALGAIKRAEFLDGWANLGIDSIDKMQTQAKEIAKTLENKTDFKEFYRWLFDFVKVEGDRKTIEVGTAVDMWNLVLTKHFTLLPKFLKFLESQGTKTVSHDLWTMLFEFARDVKPDLSNYDADGAWPADIDAFVEYVREGSQQKKKDEDD